MKKEIPILFSTPMVQAILASRKTMTRRVIKEKHGLTAEAIANHGGSCPYGKPGDILWVRETWSEPQLFDGAEPAFVYRANGDIQRHGRGKWKPSIFMPKQASRIWLEVIDIRVERLHEINVYDAGDEGVEYYNVDHEALEGGEFVADYKNYEWRDDPQYEDYHFPTYANPIDSFFSLWRKINGNESFNNNPWVWVVSFKVSSTTGKPKEKPSYNFNQHSNLQTSHF